MKWLLLTLMATLLALPIYVGIIREWSPKLRPRGYVFIIFVHAVFFATLYSQADRSSISRFIFTVIFFCWFDLTLYGIARLMTLFAQGRFLNWVDSLTPEQQLARVLMVATLAWALLAMTQQRTLPVDAPKDLASVSLLMKTPKFLRR